MATSKAKTGERTGTIEYEKADLEQTGYPSKYTAIILARTLFQKKLQHLSSR